MDVELVLTDAQLANEVGGATQLGNLLPDEYAGDSVTVRTRAMEEVLRHLVKRSPPIAETELAYPEDLKQSALYLALEWLYRQAMSDASDVFGVNRKLYERRASTELSTLTPRLIGGLRGPGMSISISRR